MRFYMNLLVEFKGRAFLISGVNSDTVPLPSTSTSVTSVEDPLPQIPIPPMPMAFSNHLQYPYCKGYRSCSLGNKLHPLVLHRHSPSTCRPCPRSTTFGPASPCPPRPHQAALARAPHLNATSYWTLPFPPRPFSISPSDFGLPFIPLRALGSSLLFPAVPSLSS